MNVVIIFFMGLVFLTVVGLDDWADYKTTSTLEKFIRPVFID